MPTQIAHPLTRANYRPYGDVFDTRTDKPAAEANQGTARRLNMLGSLDNLRPAAKVGRSRHIKLNICTFASQPRPIPDGIFEIKILERHLYSTQIFIPMTAPHRYLVIVALNDPKTDRPDLKTLACFEADRSQGISYHPGIWHHPMVALDGPSDFCVFVYEDGSADDTLVVDIPATPCAISPKPKL